MDAVRAAAGRQNIQIVRRCLWLGGASDSQHHSLRPGWWAGPRLCAVIGAPERHVVCWRRGVYQRRCSLLSTCGFYGDTAWERPAQHWGPACPVSRRLKDRNGREMGGDALLQHSRRTTMADRYMCACRMSGPNQPNIGVA
ncbi:hypothetical protein Bbelb_269780 [Branchiostoma belcheri]|nr:hypothetical protein Bbelb_269780 [Branchiostoma belcheri]